MNMDDVMQRWRERLFLAREQVAGDPQSSVEWQRDVIAEIETAVERHPEQRGRLEPVLVQARAALREGERASERFGRASAGRSRHMHAYEAASTHVPIRLLRRPWPPIERGASNGDAGSS
jgi:hypothetical protein